MHDDPVDTHSWMIGLDSRIIQDGNYPDLVTGQRTDFALEFASRGGCGRLRRTRCILAYHFIGIEDPEHQSHVGAWVTGEINLSVDPFFYFREPRK